MFIDDIGMLTKHENCITLKVGDVTVFDPSTEVLPEKSAWNTTKTNVKGRPYISTKRRFRWAFDHIGSDGKGTLRSVSECPPCDAASLFDTPTTETTAPTATSVPA